MSILHDSAKHAINMPTNFPADPAAAAYSYDINIGTPTTALPRAFVPMNALGMGFPNGSPIYAHHQLGALASPGFDDFNDMKVSSLADIQYKLTV